jgi:putative FmdB family regulatory protein
VKEGSVPTYQYTCTHCGEPVEALQKFTDEPLTVCAACGGRLRKVFSPVGIVFKGSGFYRNDSRKNGTSAEGVKEKQTSDASSSAAATSTESSSAGSGTADKPAAKKPAETVSMPSKSSSPSSSEKVALSLWRTWRALQSSAAPASTSSSKAPKR